MLSAAGCWWDYSAFLVLEIDGTVTQG